MEKLKTEKLTNNKAARIGMYASKLILAVGASVTFAQETIPVNIPSDQINTVAETSPTISKAQPPDNFGHLDNLGNPMLGFGTYNLNTTPYIATGNSLENHNNKLGQLVNSDEMLVKPVQNHSLDTQAP